LLPDFSAKAIAELGKIRVSSAIDGVKARDLRDLSWASIDNDDSRDLDRLTAAVAISDDNVKIRVAVADVDALVKKGSAIDEHARHNTTSVYTAAQTFPLLPEKLSTNLTSLNLDQDRLAIVVEIVIGADSSVLDSAVFRALVRNHAKLAYNSVAAWLEGRIDMPLEISALDGLAENLRLQDRAAQSMKNFRHAHGALCLETIEAKPIFEAIRSAICKRKKRTAPRTSSKIS
jgi:ribonuclease R